MLVLQRKARSKQDDQDQQHVIHLPSLGVCITIEKIRGNTVTVGIDAPLDAPIVRGDAKRVA